MLDSLKDIFRRRKIRRYASDIPTEFVPLSEISSINIILDVEEPGFDLLKEDILSWGRQTGIKVGIFFLDFRKLGKEELLLTSIQTTLLKRELDWIGTPDMAKVAPLIEDRSDLFISLIENGDFPIDFLSKCAKAKFKIGRYAYDGHVFDMVFSGSPTADLRSDAREIFANIKEFLNKIR